MDDPSISKKTVEEVRESYRQFERYVRVQKGDPPLLIAGKIALRILGITLMILLSPFLIIGLLIAFIAAL